MHTSPEPQASGGLGRLYRALWHNAEGNRLRLLAFVVLLLAAQAIKLAIPYLSAQAVNELQVSGMAGLSQAGEYMALVFLACLASWPLHGPGRVIERYVAIDIRAKLADALYARVVRLPMRWHEGHHTGETVHRIGKSTGALFGFAQNQFIYLQNFVNLVGPIGALFVISAATGMTALAGYLLIAFILVRVDAAMMRVNQEENRAERRYGAALVDCLGNIATVLALRLEGATQRLLGSRLDAVFAPMRRRVVLNEVKWCTVDLLNNAIRCGLVVLYAWLAWRDTGAVLIGTAVMVYQYAQQAGGVVSAMAGHYQDLVRFQADFASAEDILAAPVRATDAASVPAGWREIRIDDLSLTYLGKRGETLALRGIEMRLRRGERIALVGESGSGKSSLLRVLAGLYEADRGVFAVDGVSIAGARHLGVVTTLVPQDPEVFEGSVGHNITMGLDHAPGEVRRACDIAGFAPVLAALPSGLDTAISQGGINLSGGQKQRLALARGILAARDSSLLLLDEPTSSVDPATEARIYDKLLAERPDSCVVSAIHRLHLLPRFDRVVLMAEGRILATGSPAELHEREPRFRALWRAYAAKDEAETRAEGEPIAA